MIPARVRSNANWLLLFKLNPLDAETVYRDVVHMSRDKWQQILSYVFGDVDTFSVDNESTSLSDWMKTKRYDNLSIFVEYDMYFKNFK